MARLKSTFLYIVALLCMGCEQPEEIVDFRLAFLWGNESASNIISTDDFMRVGIEMRRDLMRRQNKLGIEPITEKFGAAVMEYYSIPPARRTTYNSRVNFGYVWIKPIGGDEESWTNTQLWVEAAPLAAGAKICHTIDSELLPWIFYLSSNDCSVAKVDICDESLPKLGITYDSHYKLALMSKDSQDARICDE